MILKQKISDEISAHDIKFNTSITIKVTKIKNEINTKIADDLSSRDGSITAEIERILNTKIANELSARLSEINSTFTAELDRINNDLNNKLNEKVNAGFGKINTGLNSKLSAEIENFKARDAGYTTEAQKIFARLFNIEEARRNDFGRITSLEKGVIDSIDDLYKKINQCYAEVRSRDLDQYSESNESEASNRSRESGNSTSSSSGSSNSPLEENRNRFKRISNESEALNRSRNSTLSSGSSNSSLDENRNRFKRVFDSKKEVGETNDYAL
jgi:hypothetical protein